MPKSAVRKELAAWLRQNKNRLLGAWAHQVFKIPGHRRLRDIIPAKIHRAGMDKFLHALGYDIEHPGQNTSNRILKKLIFKDYLSASTAEDSIHGLILLQRIMGHNLSKRDKADRSVKEGIASIIRNQINKAILYLSRTYRKRDFGRLQTIMRYGKKLIEVHDLDRLCNLILEAAMKESNSDRGSLMLLEKDGNLYIKAAVGLPSKIALTTSQRYGEGIAGRVVKTGRPIIINEGQKIPRSIKKSLRRSGLLSAVSMPIISHQRALGVLNLGKRERKPFFDDEDVELLLILAYEAGTAISNCRLFEELQNLYIGSVIALASAIDTRDHYTHGHSKNVAKIAFSIAKACRLPSEQIDKIHFAGLLHDIGKIGIPDSILLKPSKLTTKEYAVVKKHPIFAVEILKHIPRLQPIIPIIYHEHERYDGKGYVAGIKGEKIPIESRIIAVADAYEAMTSNRPYRTALSKDRAISELKDHAGTQFDPRVVNIFLRLLKKNHPF